MTAPALAQATPWGRYYGRPGKAAGLMVPSITNIKSMKAIKGLPNWAARECAEYAADNLERLEHLDRDERVQLIKGAPWREKEDSPAHIGDIVHEWIDTLAKGGKVDPEVYHDFHTGELMKAPRQAKQMWRQFGGFLNKHNPRWVKTEFTVWSDTYGYAGTADWSAYIGPWLVLGDNKTGKGVYADTAMQLGALAHADVILDTEGHEEPVPKFDRYAILHLRPRSATLVPVEHIDEWFEAFLGLKKVFDTVVNFEDKTLMYAPKIETRAA